MRDDDGCDIAAVRLENRAYSAELTYDTKTGMMLRFLETKLGAESNEYADMRLIQNW